MNSDWLFEYVWAYRVRGERARPGQEDEYYFAQRAGDWSGLIHQKHQHFNFDGIMMDSQGGGQLIWPELNKTQQRINGVDRTVTPIATVDDSSVGNAHLILCLFLREHCETGVADFESRGGQPVHVGAQRLAGHGTARGGVVSEAVQ